MKNLNPDLTLKITCIIIFLTLLNSFSIKANIIYDTIISGNGILHTIDGENENPLEGVFLNLRSESMEIYNPNLLYAYISNASGAVNYDILVYVDSTTTSIKSNSAHPITVFPNFGSDMNIYLSTPSTASIKLYNLSGQLIKVMEINDSHSYFDLSELDAGAYVYKIQTQDGNGKVGKYIKQNIPPKGASIYYNSGFKQSQLYEATYWVIWYQYGYITDSTIFTIHEGSNPPITIYLEPETTPSSSK